MSLCAVTHVNNNKMNYNNSKLYLLDMTANNNNS